MGEAGRHDKATIGVDGVRVSADDGAARSIALLVLAVALVALAAGLLLENGSEPTPATLEETSHAPSIRNTLGHQRVGWTPSVFDPAPLRVQAEKRSASISSTPA